MAVVYYRNSKTNRTYAYESKAVWNAEKGYSVPVRKYLGRVDPTTNQVIPSSGKRGRKPGSKAAGNGDGETERLRSEIRSLREEASLLRKQVKGLSEENERLRKAMERSAKGLSTALGE